MLKRRTALICNNYRGEDHAHTTPPDGLRGDAMSAELRAVAQEMLARRDSDGWPPVHEQWERLRRALAQPTAPAPPPAPEGCTPTDALVLREANHALATEAHALQTELADLYAQIKKFCAEQGEADFYTGRALALLCKVRPLEYAWPFSDKTPDEVLPTSPPQAPSEYDDSVPPIWEQLAEIAKSAPPQPTAPLSAQPVAYFINGHEAIPDSAPVWMRCEGNPSFMPTFKRYGLYPMDAAPTVQTQRQEDAK